VCGYGEMLTCIEIRILLLASEHARMEEHQSV
jgi:hypothetical protein